MVTRIRIKQTIAINLPAKDIFAYMSNLENISAWSGTVVAVKHVSPGTMCVGTRAQSIVRILGKWSEMAFEVVEYEYCRHLTLKSTSGITPCVIYFQFEPLDNGGTFITQDTTVSVFGGCASTTQQAIISAVHRALSHDLLTLKDVLEIDHMLERSIAST